MENDTDDFDIRAFAEKIEGRIAALGRDLGKVRERQKAPTEKPTGDSEGLSMAYEAGRLAAGLPDSARSRVDALVSEGRFGEAKELASFAMELGSASEARDAPKPPRAGGVSAAPTGAGAFPTSMKELVSMSKTDPKAYSRLMADPSFDTDNLR